jgi:hypothetical protein
MKQSAALVAHRFLPADAPSEVFYGGAAGGGKSDWLLMGALEYVDVPGYAAIIFRRSFTDLSLPSAIMARSKVWLADTDAVWNEQAKQWRFAGGAVLQFAYMEHYGDEERYQSAEFQYVGFDELTQFPEEQYTFLFSRLRRPMVPCNVCLGPWPCAQHPQAKPHASTDPVALALRQVPLRMRAASNPGGIGHGWVKKRFPIDGVARPGRVFIPARLDDNPHLDKVAYRKSLSHLGETLRLQLEEGDWAVAEGLAYRVGAQHRVDTFPIRDGYSRFEACDYGLNGAPWALWLVDFEGNLVCYDMVYARDLIPSELAPLITAKRKAGWGFKHRAYADPSIWHRTGARGRWGAPAMLADEFADNGVPLEPANNDPRAGMIRLRELLRIDPAHRFPSWHPRSGEYGAPRVFFTAACEAILTELEDAPVQPLDRLDGGEKVDPEWESTHGHAAAMSRYAVMTRPRASEEKPRPDLLAPADDPQRLRRRHFHETLQRRNKPQRVRYHEA